MVGREFEQLFPERASGGGDVVLDVRGVRRLPDVKEASFELRAGEVLGIAGLVGAGRSELLRAIYGVDARDAGEVLVDGRPLPAHRPDLAIAAGLGLAPEDRKSQALLLEWSLTKNVTLSDLRRFQRPLLRVRAERAAAEEQLRHLRTKPADGTRMARDLSGGNQQKVVLARWLLRRCRVLLLDEPTRGVDVETKAELFRIITDLAGQGLGVVVVSSEIEELCGLCTRILVMREGELVAELDGATATELDVLRHAMPGTQEIFAGVEPGPEPSLEHGPWSVGMSTTSASCARGAVDSGSGGCSCPPGRSSRSTPWPGSSWRCWWSVPILKPDTFPTVDNFRAVLVQASVVGVLAIGMTFVIATAGIDLSVGSVVAAAGVFGGSARRQRFGGVRGRRAGLRAPARHRQRDRDRLRQGRPLRRHARHAGHRPGPGAADEREAADQPPRPRRRALVRDRARSWACRPRS